MSFGGGQGQIRYALMFDSAQAERSVKTFQNSLTQLGAGTTIMAHKGERVDIGHAANTSTSRGGGSGSGGDIINITFRIEGNDIVNTREFKRQIKREGGTSRYTMGA